ncbi:hypothetical protein [Leeia aquatica]|uniref:Uncharacterized protein n=1 Tax=Leeia aquatica TaxID=2725557 RepID=A0A847S324_9NEIS|nr:hypothetical protein [Leeia aquatica]NLR74193.1 hypothetical protein [Leeia aquatica]
MDWNRAAREYLDAYARQQDLPGGIRFFKALQQARLDGTPASLDRLDALLEQIHDKAGLKAADLSQDPAVQRFANMVSFYIGSYLSARIGTDLTWGTREQMLAQYPDTFKLGDKPENRLVAYALGKAFTPLTYLHQKLFAQRDVSLQTTLQQTLDTYHAAARQDPNIWVPLMLRLYADKEYIGDRIALRAALERLTLDYSLESLTRIDALLRTIRKGQAPVYGDFITHPDTVNFLQFLAFYFATTVARNGPYVLTWHTYEEAQKLGMGWDLAFELTHWARLNDALYSPLLTINEILFGERQTSCTQHAQDIFRLNPPTPAEPDEEEGGLTLLAMEKAALDPEQAKACEEAGMMLAYGRFMSAGLQPTTPTILYPTQNGGGLMVPIMEESEEDAIYRADEILWSNPEKAAFAVLVRDAYHDYPPGQEKDVVVNLAVYGHAAMTVTVAAPYPVIAKDNSLRLHPVRINKCSLNRDYHESILDHVRIGMARYGSKKRED